MFVSKNDSYRKKSSKNFVFSCLNVCIICVLGFLLPRLVIVNYGSDINGLISLSSQIFSYLALLEAGIGISALQSMYKPLIKNDTFGINAILSALNHYYKKISFIYLLLLLVISLFVPFFIQTTIPYLTIVCIFLILGSVNVFSFYSQAKFKILLEADGKQYVISNFSLCIYVLTSLTKIILISSGIDVILVLSITTSLELFQNILIWIYIKNNYNWIDLSVKPDYNSLSDNKFVIIHQISSLIFNNTDIIFISLFCNLAYVSVYTIYKSFINQLRMITSIVNNSYTFVLGQVFNFDRIQYAKMLDSFDLLFTIFNHYVLSVFCALFIPFMTLYTRSFPDSHLYINNELLLLFAIVELLSGYRNAMNMSINFSKHFKQTIRQSIFESIINIFFSLLFVKWLGIKGVLLGTIIALAYRSNEIIIYGNNKILNRSSRKSYKIYFLNSAIFITLYILGKNIFINSSTYITLIVSGIKVCLIYGVVYLLVNIVFNYKYFINFFNYYMNKRNDDR